MRDNSPKKSPRRPIVQIISSPQFNEATKVKQECEIHIIDFARTTNVQPQIYDEYSFDKIKCEPELEIIDHLEDEQAQEVYINFQRIDDEQEKVDKRTNRLNYRKIDSKMTDKRKNKINSQKTDTKLTDTRTDRLSSRTIGTKVTDRRTNRMNSRNTSTKVTNKQTDRKAFKEAPNKRTIDKTSPSDPQKLLPCEFCEKSFSNYLGWVRHVSRIHKDVMKKPESVICDFCGKNYPDKASLSNHLILHKSSVSCSICQKVLRPNCMYSHMKQVHGASDSKYACPICSKVYSTVQKFKQHTKTHVKKFKCDICEREFSASYRYNQHMMWHNDKKAFSCPTCGKEFSRRSNLNEHMRIHDKKAVKRHKCGECDFKTLYVKRLRYHVQTHERQKEREEKLRKLKTAVRCDLCGAIMPHKGSMQNHLRIVHPTSFFECDTCGTRMKSKGIIKRHMVRFHLKD